MGEGGKVVHCPCFFEYTSDGVFLFLVVQSASTTVEHDTGINGFADVVPADR